MEQEQNNTLAFLDVQVTWEEDGSINLPHNSLQANAHRLIPTQDILPPPRLQVSSQQHPSPPRLQHLRPKPISSKSSITLRHPQVQRLQEHQHRHFCSVVTLPYISHISHKLRVFSQANIKVYHTAPHKIQAQLKTHKDKQDLNTMAGGYSIPCECGNVYIGETGRDLKTRIKEHQAHGRKGEIDKSTIIKH
ncbi:uncharacterized protein LOC119743355 [Patiria miniata]|uniref:GIY-YIG domain-containing protein n=1 Tax=Patiria miniata TaxID=46514 RepID=A0A914BHD1_PATMI|nr:uncharacterized protein LOC119743355 [Patiria miniata]